MARRSCISRFAAVLLSGNVGLVLNAASPTINYQPRSQAVVLYQQVAFGVIASGSPPLSYQWLRDGAPIPGATNEQILLPQSQFSDAGRYSVIVSNPENTVTSAEASLTVSVPKGGDLDCSFGSGASLNDTISSIVVQPGGKILITGGFSTVSGAARGGIARLNSDGTTDYTFLNGLAGTDSVVDSAALQGDGKIIIGGYFSAVNGVARTNLARLNPDGSLDSDFQVVPLSGNGNSSVNSIIVQSDGRVLIGGSFTNLNGTTRNGIARLNANGTLDEGFQAGMSGIGGFALPNVPAVYTMTLQRDGKVLLGGFFATVNGVSRNNIARVNPDGSLETSFQNGLSGANHYVLSIAVQEDGKFLLGGYFTMVNSVTRNYIARLNADGTLDTGFQSGTSGTTVSSVAVQGDGKLLIAGNFTSVNGVSRMGIARLNEDGSLDNGFLNGLSGASVVFNVNASGSKLFIGGSFRTVNGESRNRIARLNWDGTLDNSFPSGTSGVESDIHSVVAQPDGKVLIGGSFTNFGSTSRDYLARLNGDGTLDSSFLNGLSGVGGDVLSIALQSDGKVVVGGRFTNAIVRNVSPNRIARLNADGTLDTGFLHNGVSWANGSVESVAVQIDNKVVIGGEFTSVNGLTRSGLARLNSDGTVDNGFLNGLSGLDYGTVYSVAAQSDGKVLVGGWFNKINGVSCNDIARLNGDGSLDSGFQNGLAGVGGFFYATVLSIAVQNDGKVIIGGGFNRVNGVIRNNIARLNPDGTLDSGFQNGLTGANSTVYAIAAQRDGKVLVGGNFWLFNGVSRNGIARMNPDGTLDTSFQDGLAGIGEQRNVFSVAAEGDGKMLVGGRFTTVNGLPSAYVARLWGGGFPPQIKSITRSVEFANLTWYVAPNQTYRVQYRDNLSANGWTDLEGDVWSTGSTASKTDTTLGNTSHRFYRVVLLP